MTAVVLFFLVSNFYWEENTVKGISEEPWQYLKKMEADTVASVVKIVVNSHPPKKFCKLPSHLTFLSNPPFVHLSASELTLIQMPSTHCFQWKAVLFMPTPLNKYVIVALCNSRYQLQDTFAKHLLRLCDTEFNEK